MPDRIPERELTYRGVSPPPDDEWTPHEWTPDEDPNLCALSRFEALFLRAALLVGFLFSLVPGFHLLARPVWKSHGLWQLGYIRRPSLAIKVGKVIVVVFVLALVGALVTPDP